MKLNKILHNAKNILYYALPIALAGFLPIQEARGQDFLPPKGNINMFTSPDTTLNAQNYNKLTTRVQRDSIINVRLQEDFTKDIRARSQPTLWNCNQSTLQLIVNSHDWGERVYYADHLLYNGYTRENLDSIYINNGTLKNRGKLGLPTYEVDLSDDITIPDGHGMNAILTGDTLTNFNNWNIIEPQLGISKVKPGQLLFPENCKHVQIYYDYLFTNNKHEKNYFSWKILEFEVVDGKAKLTYNINEDNTTIIPWASPDPLNKYIKVFETRQDAITGIEDKILQENKTSVYPNPTRNYINIESKITTPTTVNITLYDITGREITKQTTNEYNDYKEKLDLSKYASGIYMLNIETKTNEHTSKKTTKIIK